jgi:hypothetical protein
VKYQSEPPLNNQYTLLKKGQEGKTGPVQGWVSPEGESKGRK